MTFYGHKKQRVKYTSFGKDGGNMAVQFQIRVKACRKLKRDLLLLSGILIETLSKIVVCKK